MLVINAILKNLFKGEIFLSLETWSQTKYLALHTSI